MSATPPPGYTPPPADLPQRGVRATFSNLMDTWITWFSATVLAQVAAMVANAYANAVVAFDSAVTASAQAAAAVSAVDALPWTSGAYSVGDVRYSLVDGRTFRCYVAVSGATDPANDRPHWVCISAGPLPYLHVRDQKTANTYGGANAGAGTNNIRTLNTTVGAITIPGASLASNLVTLPAGTYEVIATAPGYRVNSHRLSLYNSSDSTEIIAGNNALSGAGDDSTTYSVVRGRFTLTATKNVSLRHYMNYSSGSGDMGFAVNNGQPEIYAELQLWKVD